MNKDITNTIGYIYKITSPSNKVYIGQTINLIKRKSFYKRKKNKVQKAICNSINKYGWENHKFEKIDECLCGENKIHLNEKEIYWIKFYDSFNNGLNCTEGGNGIYGYKHSDEAKEKIRQAHLGTIFSEEHKNKISESHKNRTEKEKQELINRTKLIHTGKIISEKTKEKLRIINLGRKHSEETKKKITLSNIGKIRSAEAIKATAEKNKGKKRTEESKLKMRGKIRIKSECPHCKIIMDIANLKKYHLDNCKFKILSL